MKKTFLSLVCMVCACTAFVTFGEVDMEWQFKYRDLFTGSMSFDKDGHPRTYWVTENYDPSIEQCYKLSFSIFHLDTIEAEKMMDKYFPDWRERIVRDTCYSWCTGSHFTDLPVKAGDFYEMKRYSTKSNDTISIGVVDKGGPIWSYENGWPMLNADFSLREGEIFRPQAVIYDIYDRINLGHPLDYVVHTIDTIEVRGVKYRRMRIGYYNEDQDPPRTLNIWVEGIGWENGDMPGYSGYRFFGRKDQFVAKYVDGKVVFTHDDFFVPAIGQSEVERIETEQLDTWYGDDRMYDLQGREIQWVKPGELYIQHGKVKMEPKSRR